MNKKHKLLHRNNEYITSKFEIIYEEDIQRIVEEKNNLQFKIDKAMEYCEEVIKEHNNGEYNVEIVELAVKEHKENIENVLNILKENE